MPRALLTGATGYIGRHLANHLFCKGWSVHAIIRPDSDKTKIDKNINLHVITNNISSIKEALEESSPDVIFHLASNIVIDCSFDQIDNLIWSNVTFPTLIIDAAVNSRCRRVVIAGTHWQHFDATDKYRPVNLYAATKQAFEAMSAYYQRAHHFSFQNLHLLDVYGPDDTRDKLMQLLKKAAQSGVKIKMSPGYQEIDLVHVNDVVSAFVVAAHRTAGDGLHLSETWRIGTGAPLTLRQLVELFSTFSGQRIEVEWGGLPYRKDQMMRSWASSLEMPGWSPTISISEGIRQLFD